MSQFDSLEYCSVLHCTVTPTELKTLMPFEDSKSHFQKNDLTRCPVTFRGFLTIKHYARKVELNALDLDRSDLREENRSGPARIFAGMIVAKLSPTCRPLYIIWAMWYK